MMKKVSTKHIAILLLGMLGCSTVVYAQYAWIDERGVKQYSDMPPPITTPRAKILKAPNLKPMASAPSPSGDAATAEGAENPAENPAPPPKAKEKDKTPLTTAEKNTEYQKRKAEQAEKDKKTGEEAKAATDKKNNCESARAYLRSLESGQRIAATGKNGEKSYIDDKQRADELQRAKQIIAECK